MKRTRLLVILLPLAFFLWLPSCLPTFESQPPHKMKSEFAPLPVPESHLTESESRELFWVSYQRDAPKIAVFVHGSPGNWQDFKWFLKDEKMRENWGMISVDRPGYGGTQPGESEPSLEVQAEIIGLIFESLESQQEVVLVGHSLGGPVIAQLAVNFPEKVDGLVFIAASMDPALEKMKWYQIPAQWPLIRSVIPEALRMCNEEILPLKEELEKQQSRLSEIEVPCVILQGEKDTLVPPENADYLMRELTRAPTLLKRFPESNHFIPFTEPERIQNVVLQWPKITAQAVRKN